MWELWGTKRGPSFQAAVYPSKQLDSTVYGWLPCLQALSSAATIKQEAKMFTLVQSITVHSHHFSDLISHKMFPTLMAGDACSKFI